MTVHVAGAGIAGLATAVAAAEAGHEVIVHEAARTAGGRLRSIHDPGFGVTLDNGPHVLLGANASAWRYVERIGAKETLVPAADMLPFRDLRTGDEWSVPVAGGALAALIGARSVRLWEVARLAARFAPRPGATVADAYSGLGVLYARVLAPLALAVMNRPPDKAEAVPFRDVLWRIVWAGAGGLRPWLARGPLFRTFVGPAIAALARAGGAVRLGDGLKALEVEGGRLAGARFARGAIRLAADDRLVLALPPRRVKALGKVLVGGPVRSGAIVNAHFLTPALPPFPGGARLLGVTGGRAQWLAYRAPVLSVTVSAADGMAGWPASRIAARLWRDAARAMGRDAAPVPPVRVVKERRATVAAARPAGPGTAVANLFLAGGWTVPGAPDTIDSAARSAERTVLCLGIGQRHG